MLGAGYWKIHGLATPIRLLLHYVKTPFVDEMFEQGDAPTYSREEWLSVKATMSDVDFINLPYFIDADGFALTQSCAIKRYIAHKYAPELYGSGEAKAVAKVDQALESVCDFRSSVSRVAYGNNPAPEVFAKEVLPAGLAPFEAVLKKHAFLAGETLSIADFAFYVALDSASGLVKSKGLENAVAASPIISAYMARFAALPGVAEYLADPANTMPFNNKVAMHQY